MGELTQRQKDLELARQLVKSELTNDENRTYWIKVLAWLEAKKGRTLPKTKEELEKARETENYPKRD